MLAESFESRFGLAAESTQNRLGGQDKVGLIFNAALVGSFPSEPCDGSKCDLRDDVRSSCFSKSGLPLPLRERTSVCEDYRSSQNGGGRLIFTNFDAKSVFPNRAEGPAHATDEYLTYVTIQDPQIPLTRAAAISANFPPVFSNAAVDVQGRELKRYWATDGGATDNRGVVSLLYAIDAAVRGKAARNSGPNAPSLHVIIAEASAVDLSYKQDRGIGAKFGAPAKFASQIMVDLVDSIRSNYKGKLVVHYLSMPLVLRSNGGLGTHWMLPHKVKFREPLSVPPHSRYGAVQASLDGLALYRDAIGVARRIWRERSSVTLDGEIVRSEIVDRLHRLGSAAEQGNSDPDEQKVWRWICNDKYRNHADTWADFVASVMDGARPKTFVAEKCEAVSRSGRP